MVTIASLSGWARMSDYPVGAVAVDAMTYPQNRDLPIRSDDLPAGWTRVVKYGDSPFFAKLVVRDAVGYERSSAPLGYYCGSTYGSKELGDLIILAQDAVTAAVRVDFRA